MNGRQDIAEELIRMYYEHPCCSDPQLFEELIKEARSAGWNIPESIAFGYDHMPVGKGDQS